MKPLLLIFLSSLLIGSSCRKHKTVDPVSQLPPETQTGANTFGCLVDGKIFLPKGDPFGGPIKKAAYQLVNNRFHFLVSGSRSLSTETSSIGLFADSLQMTVGAYELTSKNIPGKLYGQYAVAQIGGLLETYLTNDIEKGQLIFKKLDEVNQIVSGTFWFDAKNANGQIVQIREGRFDLPYVK
jgi:hypothetical protein